MRRLLFSPMPPYSVILPGNKSIQTNTNHLRKCQPNATFTFSSASAKHLMVLKTFKVKRKHIVMLYSISKCSLQFVLVVLNKTIFAIFTTKPATLSSYLNSKEKMIKRSIFVPFMSLCSSDGFRAAGLPG